MLRWGFRQIKAKGGAESGARKLHLFVTKSQSFRMKVKELSRAALLDELDAARRLSKHKEILSAAVRQSRNTLFSNYQASFEATCIAHGSLARAVMHNDKELAKVLIERLIGGADYVAIRDGKVMLIDPIAFARDAEQAKSRDCGMCQAC